MTKMLVHTCTYMYINFQMWFSTKRKHPSWLPIVQCRFPAEVFLLISLKIHCYMYQIISLEKCVLPSRTQHGDLSHQLKPRLLNQESRAVGTFRWPLVHGPPQWTTTMDYQNGLPKWTTLMDCQMDYLDGLPKKTTLKKKDRKKYFLLVVCLDRFTTISHLVFISCLLPLLKWYAGTYCRIIQRPQTPPSEKNWIYHELKTALVNFLTLN